MQIGVIALDLATRENAGHDGLIAAGRKGNEAVAPSIISMRIITEGRQPGGLVRAGHKVSAAAAPPRLCRSRRIWDSRQQFRNKPLFRWSKEQEWFCMS